MSARGCQSRKLSQNQNKCNLYRHSGRLGLNTTSVAAEFHGPVLPVFCGASPLGHTPPSA